MEYKNDRINQAQDYFSLPRGAADYHAFTVQQVRIRGRQIRVGEPDDVDSNAPPVLARIDDGRWVGDCECGAGMLLMEGHPFMCGECGNAAYGGKYRPVTWPGDASREAGEAELLKRGRVDTRNWWPDRESLEYLRAETEKLRGGGR